MLRFFGWTSLVLGLLAIIIFAFGFDEDIVYGYRDWKHEQWLEEWLKTARPTFAENAHHLPAAVTADYLGEQKDVEIFLPKGYEDNDSVRYPVLYFYDGDNLFDQITGEGSEWEVDEWINRTDSLGGPSCIVVGVSSGDNRSAEYKPYPSDQVREEGEVFGKKHAEWYARGLKQWVDANYRTKPEPEFTGIGGCSLGGLMAHYSLMTYPDVYGLGIIFSPSLWVDEPQSLDLVDAHPDVSKLRVFINSGELETPIVEGSERLRDRLLVAGLPEDQLLFDIEPGEGHWHATWKKGFKKAYPWIVE
ncbi:alpha/beta hydrolase [Neolewinella agarilytica]|uniref:Predicted hydrolase of the alpha/beta superfamily n=1 Tax=Neolewinella agarilytica TaxID=478744 RepID=A0A1H8ZDP4_9BACT|nr:alpha/beta hydrolase-fold protein [Neolewinella agarilytica]SEP62503.1 Predicted hydrolase of the alpha/beta superfamily [Neolewinella agarilytica]